MPGRVRRLVTRALLILGGALAATAAAWLLCTATASADQLPLSPTGPAADPVVVVGGATEHAAGALAPVITRLPDPSAGLANAGAVDKVDTVTVQVRDTVTGLTPAWVPPAELIPAPGDLVRSAESPVTPDAPARPVTTAPDTGGVATSVAAAGLPPVAGGAAHLQHDRVTGATTASGHPTGPARAGVRGHRLPPVLPYLPPAGSTDSTTGHGTGGVTGGPGVGVARLVRPVGMASPLARAVHGPVQIAPGDAPGTTPD